MIINDYVLMELNQQRRAQVAENLAALRATKDQHRRWARLWRRRNRTVPSPRPVTNTVAFGTGSTAR
jgi:hypothetical protein